MYDISIFSSHPESPVDSSMFPAIYSISQAFGGKADKNDDEDQEHEDNMVKKPNCLVYDCEVAPFEFPQTPRATKEEAEQFELLSVLQMRRRSVTSEVFADHEFVDEIVCSLEIEQMLSQFTVSANGPTEAVASATGSSISMPVIRKPGTFLNKEGRWIKGKPCRMEDCDKRAQSNGLCKGHGGGARCNSRGCSKSSQGGGYCRAHGGGKRCLHDGCDKGTQRNGFCYLHGGVRSCSVEGCDKKDRGNGKCFAHGGGRKCTASQCSNTTRRGVLCDNHATTRNSI